MSDVCMYGPGDAQVCRDYDDEPAACEAVATYLIVYKFDGFLNTYLLCSTHARMIRTFLVEEHSLISSVLACQPYGRAASVHGFEVRDEHAQAVVPLLRETSSRGTPMSLPAVPNDADVAFLRATLRAGAEMIGVDLTMRVSRTEAGFVVHFLGREREQG